MSQEVTSLGVQVHGGMGFIEETGAAQHYRDSKILTIYEGTTAIQANDLVGRKTARDGGQLAKAVAAQIEADRGRAAGQRHRRRPGRGPAAGSRAPGFLDAVDFMAANGKQPTQRRLCRQRALPDVGGNLVAGWQMGRALLVAQQLSSWDRIRPSCRPRSPRRASTPSTFW